MKAPSPYGKDDHLGAANLLTPKKVLEALSSVTRGRVYSLAVETGPGSPSVWPRRYEAHMVMPAHLGGEALGSNAVRFVDEIIHFWPGVGTHIDGFGHVARGESFYNGNPLPSVVAHDGLRKFGVEGIPPIVTRAVLFDVPALKGVDVLEPGYAITEADLREVQERAGVRFEAGDAALVRTGWIRNWAAGGPKYTESNPGLGKAAARYLAEAGAVLVASDQGQSEVLPFEDENECFPVHQILLVDYGVYQIQNISLEEMAADGVASAMFVVGVPRLVGPSQMTVHPIAIC